MNCLLKLKDWLIAKRRDCLGIYVQEHEISMAVVENDECGVQHLRWYDVVRRIDDEGDEEFFSRAAMQAMQNIYEDTMCYLVLEGEDVFYYEKIFPDLSEKELLQGVKLDFAAASGWHGDYLLSYEQIIRDKGVFRIGGIGRDALRAKVSFWENYFSVEGCILYCYDDERHMAISNSLLDDFSLGKEKDVKWSKDVIAAVYGAAAGGLHKQACLFRENAFKYKWNWLHCCAGLWGISLLLGIVGGLFLSGISYNQKEDLEIQIGKLALMNDVAERKQVIDEDKKVIERKNKMLGKIRENGLGGQGIMINAGRIIKEGIWLTEISAEAGRKMTLSGKARNYKMVSHLMEEIQKDDEFFKGELYLSSADVGKDGMISFQMNGKM